MKKQSNILENVKIPYYFDGAHHLLDQPVYIYIRELEKTIEFLIHENENKD